MSDGAANKAVVATFLETFSTGNVDEAMSCLSDDATWWVSGKLDGISGKKSKAEFVQVLAGAVEAMEGPIRLTPVHWTAEGERVAVEMESYAKLKDGREYANVYHSVFVVRDGKIRSVREYPDTDTIRSTFLTPA